MFRVRLFGMAREIAGTAWVELDHGDNEIRVKDLKAALLELYPSMSSLLSCRIAVNLEYADDTDMVRAQDEIALIPPVSGG